MRGFGFFATDKDDEIECSCGYEGACVITDDYADRTIWWTCPECGHPGNETYGDDLD